ncbi:LysM peptidoglycan-binding domain-containing protein [Thiohalophilus sp.]|uniref:LysM peptidoglycan-binding domain-containing protein n=1 Tax=Thiohalophilus sp. TaxID=3028392 RepID=UPI00397583D9
MKKTENKPAHQQERQTALPEQGATTDSESLPRREPMRTSVDWEIPGDVPEKERRAIYPGSPVVNPQKRNTRGAPDTADTTQMMADERSSSSVNTQTSEILKRRSFLSVPGVLALVLIIGLSGLAYMHFSVNNDALVSTNTEHVDVSDNVAMEDAIRVMPVVLSDVSEKTEIQPVQDVQSVLPGKTEGVANSFQEQRIITHVVKKGDTLWDIAEYYVNDPFRYPELATLSEIENPDMIYPGEIVRIRI